MSYLNNPDIIRSINYIKSLTPHNRDILNYYTETPSLNDIYNYPNNTCDTIKNLEEMFDNSPPLTKDMIVYRGLDITEFQKINFELKKLVSTTLNSDETIGFMKRPEDFYLLEIKLPAGIKFLAVSLPEFSHPELDEILLPPGGTFNVISEEKIDYTDNFGSVFNIKKLYVEYIQKTEKINCIQSIEATPINFLYRNIKTHGSKIKPSDFFKEKDEFEDEDQLEVDLNIEEYIKELASQAIDLTHRFIIYGYINKNINFKKVIIKYMNTDLRKNIKEYIRTTRPSYLYDSREKINDVISELHYKISNMTKPNIDMFQYTLYRWNNLDLVINPT
jgi:hypothetical protein